LFLFLFSFSFSPFLHISLYHVHLFCLKIFSFSACLPSTLSTFLTFYQPLFRLGVSCDSCERDNFRGRRYKCLVCFDFDLCSRCYESKFHTEFHRADHPMQCILTRYDYGRQENHDSVIIMFKAYACPLCEENGFTESMLQEHITSHHGEHHAAVLCPVCAATPNAELNRTIEDLATHLTEDHLR
uniref:E3 ubiquitin-protein ligase KCMF1 n=1 Tax=Soboliphyme baturini TaxID=241478 RepID=A0A183IP85_9BILA